MNDRASAVALVVAVVVILTLFYFGLSSACDARGGHLSFSPWRRDVLCLSEDGRVLE